MPEQINTWMAWLEQHPDLFTLCASVLLVLIAVACNWLVKRILVRGLQMVASSTRLWREAQLHDSGIIKRLSNVVPALIISKGVTLIDGFPETFATVVSNVCNAFIVLTIAIAINGHSEAFALWIECSARGEPAIPTKARRPIPSNS